MAAAWPLPALLLLCLLWSPLLATNYLCPQACSCLGPMVDCSKRGLTQVPTDLPHWVEILDLQSNEISDLPDLGLAGLTKLEEFDLSNNKLMSVNASFFQSVPNLHTLKLGYNQLSEIPYLNYSTNLTHLVLNHNQIETISPASLGCLPKLRQLDLNFNQITKLTAETFPVHPSMHQLYLNNNKITILQAGALDNLTSLESLKISKNKLSNLPKNVFEKLGKLKFLDMNRNRFRIIDGLSFKGLDSLTSLKLRRNHINELMDGAFWGLSNIQNLQLDYNNITSVTKGWLYGLTTLQQLSLAHNHISLIEQDGWEFCQKLLELDLTHNDLSTIAAGTFSQLDSLKLLYLDHNRISYIGDGAFQGLQNLETLNMNHNEISWTIEDMNGAFDGLGALQLLGLSSNRIKSLAKRSFQGLESLKKLHLVDNAISSIQMNAFTPMESLIELKFNTSSLLCDCHLAWLPEWLREAGFETTVQARCGHPESMAGKSIFEVNPRDFTCNDIPKPVLIEEPESQIALRGANVTLKCVAESSSDSEMSFMWKKDNRPLVGKEVVNMESTDGTVTRYTSQLNLRHVTDSAEGKYQCICSNLLGATYSRKAEITVHVFPTFTKKPEDVTVRAGTTARLDCAATGDPAPVIAWQKDGGDDFPAARERRMHVMPDDAAFFIVSVKSSDQGVYSCTATNAAGTIMANTSLSVLETPAFVKPMENQEQEEGKTTVLECMASGSPKPRLHWLKDDEDLKLTDRHFLTADNQLLIIVHTKPSDAGTYTCEMANTLGMERGTAELSVLPLHPIEEELTVGMDDDSTTTGIIIIAVVCCVVGTSLVWVIIIYQTRKKSEEYSSTPTDETTLPGDVPGTPYHASDKDGSSSPGPLPPPLSTSFTKYPGFDLSAHEFSRVRPMVMFPSDAEDDDHRQYIPLTLDEQRPAETSDNSITALHRMANSDSDTVHSASPSTHSTRSTQSTTVLHTFQPQRSRSHSQELPIATAGRHCHELAAGGRLSQELPVTNGGHPCHEVPTRGHHCSHGQVASYSPPHGFSSQPCYMHSVNPRRIPDEYPGSRPPDFVCVPEGGYHSEVENSATFPRSSSPVHNSSSQSLKIHRLPKDSRCSSISGASPSSSARPSPSPDTGRTEPPLLPPRVPVHSHHSLPHHQHHCPNGHLPMATHNEARHTNIPNGDLTLKDSRHSPNDTRQSPNDSRHSVPHPSCSAVPNGDLRTPPQTIIANGDLPLAYQSEAEQTSPHTKIPNGHAYSPTSTSTSNVRLPNRTCKV